MQKILTYKNRKVILSAAFFAALFSLALIFGKTFYDSGDISAFASNLTANLLHILLLTAVVSIILILIFKANLESTDSNFSPQKIFFFSWIVIFICWLPCYIAYFPGIWSYDISTQAGMFNGHYTSHHPPLHTLILEICSYIFSYDMSKAVPFYGICQMLFLSFTFAKSAKFMCTRHTPAWIIALSIVFYSANPVIAIFSFIPVKDSLCAGFFILLSLEICNLIADSENYLSSTKCKLHFTIIALFFCLLRNNAVYALIVATVIAFFIFKRMRHKALITFLSPILIYFIITTFVYSSLGIEKGSSAEFLSVPLQQIARVVTYENDTLSASDKEEISKFLPYDSIPELYNRRFADPIKDNFNNSYGIKPVIIIWFKLLPSHIKTYINAFLDLHVPYWYPNATAKDPVSGVLYIETNYRYLVSGPPFWNADLLPEIRDIYEDVADYTAFESLPQIFNPFSLSFAVWFMLFCLFRLISIGIKKSWFILILPILFWCTYLLGPVSNLRYLIPIIFQYPLFFVCAFSPKHIFGNSLNCRH